MMKLQEHDELRFILSGFPYEHKEIKNLKHGNWYSYGWKNNAAHCLRRIIVEHEDIVLEEKNEIGLFLKPLKRTKVSISTCAQTQRPTRMGSLYIIPI
jgi:hypothetical protein